MVKLRRVYEYNCFESQKDLDDLKDHLGDDLYNDYMKIRDRIPKDQNDYKDFQKLKKLPIDDVQDFVDNFQSETERRKEAKKGAKKLYEDSNWIVYRITTPEAAIQYGKGTKWCISGTHPKYPGVSGAEFWYDHYIKSNEYDGGFYFYISKKDSKEKYCVLQNKDGKVVRVYDSGDDCIASSKSDLDVELPDIPQVHFNDYDEESLYKATKSNNLDKVKKLLKHDIDVNYLDPINEAVKNNNIDMVKLLLKNGASVTGQSLADAIDNDNFVLVKLLVKNLNNGELCKHISILKAVEHNNIEMVDYLLKHNFFISPPCVYKAVSNGNIDMVKLLLKKGGDINYKDSYEQTPLIISLGDTDIFRLLVENGADISKLYYQIGSLSQEQLEILLENGLDVNNPINSYSSPLLHEVNSLKLLGIILKHGADINKKDSEGNTPLLNAIYSNRQDKVEYLIKNKADVTIKNNDDYTPILYACKYSNSPEVINALLKAGANIEDKDRDGNTPLCLACINGDLKLARFLVNAGSNKEVKNNRGKSPKQLTTKKSIKDLM